MENTLTIPAELSPQMFLKSRALVALHNRRRKMEVTTRQREYEDRARNDCLDRIASVVAELYPDLAVKYSLTDDDQLADAVESPSPERPVRAQAQSMVSSGCHRLPVR